MRILSLPGLLLCSVGGRFYYKHLHRIEVRSGPCGRTRVFSPFPHCSLTLTPPFAACPRSISLPLWAWLLQTLPYVASHPPPPARFAPLMQQRVPRRPQVSQSPRVERPAAGFYYTLCPSDGRTPLGIPIALHQCSTSRRETTTYEMLLLLLMLLLLFHTHTSF